MTRVVVVAERVVLVAAQAVASYQEVKGKEVMGNDQEE